MRKDNVKKEDILLDNNKTAKVLDENNNVNIKTRKKRYKLRTRYHISFNARISFYLIMFVLSFFFCTIYLFKSITYVEEKYYNFKEQGYVNNYKFHLKKENFYEKEYIEKNDQIIPVASYIDDVIIDFLYDFKIDTNVNANFTYNIVADLIISGDNSNANYYKKRFIIKKPTIKSLNAEKEFKLNETVKIDYNYYNDIANHIKNELNGIDSQSELIITLMVNKNNTKMDDEIKLSGNSNISISIPLSKKAINVKPTSNNINDKKEIYSEAKYSLNRVIYLIISIILFITTNYMIIKLIRLLSKVKPKKNRYDEYIKKLLIQYDRLIVETQTAPKLDENNIIKIKKFEELLDVRDNIKKPILFYDVTKHEKSYFFIKNEKDIYLLVLKAVDINN